MTTKLFEIKTVAADEPEKENYECGSRAALVHSHPWLRGLLPKDDDDDFFRVIMVWGLTRWEINRL